MIKEVVFTRKNFPKDLNESTVGKAYMNQPCMGTKLLNHLGIKGKVGGYGIIEDMKGKDIGILKDWNWDIALEMSIKLKANPTLTFTKILEIY